MATKRKKVTIGKGMKESAAKVRRWLPSCASWPSWPPTGSLGFLGALALWQRILHPVRSLLAPKPRHVGMVGIHPAALRFGNEGHQRTLVVGSSELRGDGGGGGGGGGGAARRAGPVEKMGSPGWFTIASMQSAALTPRSSGVSGGGVGPPPPAGFRT